jgi:hypothetical protein
MERSGTPAAHVLSLRIQGGAARPLAEDSRPSPVLQIAPQARVPPSSGPKQPLREEDRTLRAVLVGMLREIERR